MQYLRHFISFVFLINGTKYDLPVFDLSLEFLMKRNKTQGFSLRFVLYLCMFFIVRPVFDTVPECIRSLF